MSTKTSLDELCINTLRFLAVDAVEQARSGHPGAPLGAAPMAYILWDRFLKHNPVNPAWPDRDRFVLSMGHASMLLYALLHLYGYPLPLEELQRFRQWGSKTPGHPEYDPEVGVETTTGPLGQGLGNAVGMAIAEAHLAAVFNRPGLEIVDHYTYVMASDGDMMEGINHEAASLAGHLRLGKLVVLYDANRITIEGSTDLAFSEDVGQRYRAYGWHVQTVADGNDLGALERALAEARQERSRPSLIIVRTHIGYGSPKQDSEKAHGEPLGPEAARATKERLGWPLEPPFFIPDEVREHMQEAQARGRDAEQKWQALFQRWAKAYPDLAERWEQAWSQRLPRGWDQELPVFRPEQGPMATRSASGKTINAIARKVSYLLGGSADLAPSNKTRIEDVGDLLAGSYQGRNLHFGVREHIMGGVLNGLTLHGGLRAFGGTFLIFSDYMRPTIRLAAMMRVPVIYVFTHDSIALGEDGPTHQPVEHLASLRAIPNLTVLRPADANETVAAWRLAMEQRTGPVALVLTRQKLPILDPDRYPVAEGVPRGAYILSESRHGRPRVILIATGSEVHLALQAQERLEQEGVPARVVSMPSWERFADQPVAYRDHVLPPDVRARIAIEAAVPLGWERWVGDHGRVIGLNRFGASAPYPEVMERLGFHVERIVKEAHELVHALGAVKY